jgi:UDPglucose--hexose-1-phosphate uridylyltransferase
VVVFENRFPTLKTAQAAGRRDGPLASRPAAGQCEVVCFSQRHTASFADLSPGQAATAMAAWADRSAELAGQPGVEQARDRQQPV